MIDLTPIAPNIQKRLFEKTQVLGRTEFPGQVVKNGAFAHSKLAVRSTFVRMASSLENPVILVGGELTYGTTDYDGFGVPGTETIAGGYFDIYGSRVIKKPKDYDFFDDTTNTENKFKRPMPGLKSIDVAFRGGLRALREATVSWTCWSFEDIDRLMPHFLAHGKTVLLEWGWVYDKSSLLNIPTFIGQKGIKPDAYTDYKNKILEANGDFDMMVGIIKNFEFTTREDGGFDCSTVLTSLGTNILDNPIPSKDSTTSTPKLDISNKDTEKEVDEKLKDAKEEPDKVVENDIGATLKLFIANIDKYLGDKITKKFFSDQKGGTNWGTFLGANEYVKHIPNQFIIKYKRKETGGGNYTMKKYGISEIHDAWVRWGWFEDNILSKFLTVVSPKAEVPIIEFRSVEDIPTTSGKQSKIYESTHIKNHPEFETININNYILPGQFTPLTKPAEATRVVGTGDSTYLHKLAKIVNENFKPFAEYEQKVEKVIKKGYEQAGPGISDEERYEEKTINAVKNFEAGYLRNMLINTKLIKEAFGVSEADEFTVERIDVREALNAMFSLLNQDLYFWKFNVANDSVDTHRVKIIDENISNINTDPKVKMNSTIERKSYTKSVYADNVLSSYGIFYFPVWTNDSIVKRQNITATVPNAMALSIMYGANVDQVPTTGGPKTETTQEGEAAGGVGKDVKNQSTNKDLSIVLKQSDYETYGSNTATEYETELSQKGGDDDLITWLKNNKKTITEKYKAKVHETNEEINAAKEAKELTDIESKLDNSIPPPLPKHLSDEEWESIGEMETYETEDGDAVAYEFALSRLYSSKYDKENRMKQLFIDSIEYNTTNFGHKTTTTVTETSKPLLIPLELEIDIDGTGGIFPGNSFHSTYLPTRYQEDTVFQAFDVNHTVDSSGWTTTIKGKMRTTMERLVHTEVEKILPIDKSQQFVKYKSLSDRKAKLTAQRQARAVAKASIVKE